MGCDHMKDDLNKRYDLGGNDFYDLRYVLSSYMRDVFIEASSA